MKICLIHPSYSEGHPGRFPSLGLGYIATVLEDNGYNVDYIDLGASDVTESDLSDRLLTTTPDIVGFTCNSPSFGQAKKLAEIVRKYVPNALTVAGGRHLDVYPKETVQNPEFDFGIYGEGEYPMLQLIKILETDRKFHKVNGLIYKQNGNIVINPPYPLIRNLDDIPFPARHLMPNDEYHSPMTREQPFTTMVASRGCPFRCFYCRPTYGGIFRTRSAGNIVDEIEACINEFGMREIQFYDDTFTVNSKRVNEICDKIIERGINIIWDCRTRVDLVDKELLMKMKNAGCYRIRYGVESGDQSILNLMKTGITLDQVRTTFRWTKESGIESLAYFMIGIPGETMESIEKTIDFAKKLKPDRVRFSITTAYPGTEMYNSALKEGYFDRDVWREHTLGLTSIQPEPIFETAEYTKEDLENITKKAYEEFHS